MKQLSDFWFWFGLLVAPILMFFSLFYAGSLLGQSLYSQDTETYHIGELAMMASGLCGMSLFIRSIKQLRVKFRRK